MNSHPEKKNSEEEDEIPEAIQFHQISPPTVGSRHIWRQEGPHLICDDCESRHGYRIGVNKRLKGFDINGNPILETV